MQSLSNFNFNTNTIRVVTIDGNPWFVAADVCRVLSLDLAGGVHRHLGKLDASETHKLPLGLRGGQTNTISESGLYKLVMRSDKPQAKPLICINYRLLKLILCGQITS